MRRSLVLLTLLLVLFRLTTETVAACMMVFSDALHVRCGDQEVQLASDQLRYRDAELARISDSCGETADSLKQLVDTESARHGYSWSYHFTPWSPSEEASLWVEKHIMIIGECDYRDYARVDAWLVSYERQRFYCYNANYGSGGLCPSIHFSPLVFTLYILTRLDAATLPYQLLVILPVVFGIVYLAIRRELRRCFRPSRRSVVLSLCVPLLWFGLNLDALNLSLLPRSPELVIDLLYVAMASYFLSSLIGYVPWRKYFPRPYREANRIQSTRWSER